MQKETNRKCGAKRVDVHLKKDEVENWNIDAFLANTYRLRHADIMFGREMRAAVRCT